jgi:hypothetical protein
MSAIDDKILETLNSEDRKILDSYGKELGLLRLWYFMELNRQSVIWEVKRLELQIALLVKRP